MKAELELRKADIQRAIDQSLANHNGLIGRLSECQDQLAFLAKKEEDAKIASSDDQADNA